MAPVPGLLLHTFTPIGSRRGRVDLPAVTLPPRRIAQDLVRLLRTMVRLLARLRRELEDHAPELLELLLPEAGA